MFKEQCSATWASRSVRKRALSYYRVRIIGGVIILITLLLLQAFVSIGNSGRAIFLAALDIFVSLWLRATLNQKYPKCAMWLSIILSALIVTIGLHLGGGFISLSFGFYLILIVSAALVFWTQRAAYMAAIVVSSAYAILVIAEIRFGHFTHSVLRDVYDFSKQPRLLITNLSLAIAAIFITTAISGEAAELLGRWSTSLSDEVEEKTKKQTLLVEKIEKTYISIVNTLANAIEARDYYTNKHSNRMTVLTEKIAEMLNRDDTFRRRLHFASMLHDVGKIGVPDYILNKTGKLTAEEREIMRRHPIIGEKIVSNVEEMQDVALIVRAHHEKFDGSGYPDHLQGEEIPLEARIIAVADAYAAITDERPYKAARSSSEAIQEIIRCSGTHFDPQVVDAFLSAIQLAPHII